MYISYIAYTPFAFQITQYNYYLQEWFSSSILLNVSIYRIAKKKSKLIRKKINSLLRGIRINMPISIIHHHHITITHKYIHTHTRFCCPLYTHTLFPLYSLWPSKEDWFITDYHLLNKKFDNNQTCLPAGNDEISRVSPSISLRHSQIAWRGFALSHLRFFCHSAQTRQYDIRDVVSVCSLNDAL